MMNWIRDKTQVYMIGIGGIGMSALARYFRHRGLDVSGYDRMRTTLTDALAAEGIAVHYEDRMDQVPADAKDASRKGATLVVYTPAVPSAHTELCYFLRNGYTVKKRAEVLGVITEGHFTIAVAGTHGKTTTSSIVAHVLKSAGASVTAFLGGIVQNYNSNVILPAPSAAPEYMVVEADEYDRSFLQLHPDIAVVTSAEADHLDVYGDREGMLQSYGDFLRNVRKNGTAIVRKGCAAETMTTGNVVTYSAGTPDGADYHAANITLSGGQYVFDIVGPGSRTTGVSFRLPGMHNIENAVAAAAVMQTLGIGPDAVRNALASFRGIRRRFECVLENDRIVFIDDYAHHPTELDACIRAVRDFYPGRRLTGVFQPHLYSRTRDFMAGFAESLGALDEVILLDIYPAREAPIAGVTSAALLEKIPARRKSLCAKDKLVQTMAGKDIEVLLTLGAGDIEALVDPLKAALEKKYSNETEKNT